MNSTRLRLAGGQTTGASLTIVQAQPRLDESVYECSLAGGHSPSDRTHRFELKLLVPPRLAPFEFPRDAQVGMKVLLTCSALEGQQPISFVWLRDNQIIVPSAAPGTTGPAADDDDDEGAGPEEAGERAPSSLAHFHQQQLADKLALSPHAALALGQRNSEYVLIQPDGPTAAQQQPGSGREPKQAQAHEQGDEEEGEGAQGERQRDKSVASAGRGRARQAGARQLLDPSIRIRQADDYSILSIDSIELKHAGRYTCSAQNEAARASHSSQLVINGEWGALRLRRGKERFSRNSGRPAGRPFAH